MFKILLPAVVLTPLVQNKSFTAIGIPGSLKFILGFSSNIFAKKAAIVIDFDTEEVLFEVNADTRNYPASLTKIMTLYIVFDYINKGKLSYDSQLSVSSVAASRSPSKLYLETGSSIKVKNAVNALIIKSGLSLSICIK